MVQSVRDIFANAPLGSGQGLSSKKGQLVGIRSSPSGRIVARIFFGPAWALHTE